MSYLFKNRIEQLEEIFIGGGSASTDITIEQMNFTITEIR